MQKLAMHAQLTRLYPRLQGHWPAFEAKMRDAKLSDAAIGAFKQNYDQLVAGVTGLVSIEAFRSI